MAITTRAGKGSELTHAELDTNFTDLRDGVDMMVPKEKTKGIRVDSEGTPDFGWHDLHGFPIQNPNDPNKPSIGTVIGGIQCCQYAEGNQTTYRFHIPHDYLMGSDLFMHCHWLHNSAVVTGGTVTWGYEISYVKGHDQGAFHTPKLFSITQAASTTPHQHMIAEGACSVSGGSAIQLDTDELEVDGIILCRFYLDSNDITTSNASTVDPFVFFLDIHYQSTGVPTKQRQPDFWT